jgi:hypothetical protein
MEDLLLPFCGATVPLNHKRKIESECQSVLALELSKKHLCVSLVFCGEKNEQRRQKRNPATAMGFPPKYGFSLFWE